MMKISVELDDDLAGEVLEEADGQGMLISDLIRDWIEDAMIAKRDAGCD